MSSLSITRPPPFVDSFMDGCGEAGEAQGILDGSNFVATSLQLRSDFVATSSDLACKEVQAQKSGASLTPNAQVPLKC